MKIFMCSMLMCILNATLLIANDCSKWQVEVDDTVIYKGRHSDISKINEADKIIAISCLLELKGKDNIAKIGGATTVEASSSVPMVSVEIAALFYIRAIYYESWVHCLGITLEDNNGVYNTRSSVQKAYASYKKWFDKVKVIGTVEARRQGIDPMDDCPDVHWYGQTPGPRPGVTVLVVSEPSAHVMNNLGATLTTDEFYSTEEIEKWAASYSFGYDKYKFIHEGNIIFIIISSKTSGLASSEINIFVYRNTDKLFKRILTRNKTYDLCTAAADNDGVKFLSAKKEMILYIPWRGFEFGRE